MSNQTSHFGIMGGLYNRKISGRSSSNRVTSRLTIPPGAAAGLSYMKMHNLLSKNPQTGGVGKVVKSKPCNCNVRIIKENESKENLEDTTLGDNKQTSCVYGKCCSKNDGSESVCTGCYIDAAQNYCCDSSDWDGSGCTDISAVCGKMDSTGCNMTSCSLCGGEVPVCPARYGCDGDTGTCHIDDQATDSKAECTRTCKRRMGKYVGDGGVEYRGADERGADVPRRRRAGRLAGGGGREG